MNKPFNKLTDAEAERIAKLMEECGEVIQACGKVLLHGYESFNPDAPEKGNNRRQLEAEIAHVIVHAHELSITGEISYESVGDYMEQRNKKIAEGKCYLHHQP